MQVLLNRLDVDELAIDIGGDASHVVPVFGSVRFCQVCCVCTGFQSAHSPPKLTCCIQSFFLRDRPGVTMYANLGSAFVYQWGKLDRPILGLGLLSLQDHAGIHRHLPCQCYLHALPGQGPGLCLMLACVVLGIF